MRILIAAMIVCATASVTAHAKAPIGSPLPPPLPPPTVAAPELNSGVAGTALTLLLGSILVLRGRQTRR
jgi:hypothetical protein